MRSHWITTKLWHMGHNLSISNSWSQLSMGHNLSISNNWSQLSRLCQEWCCHLANTTQLPQLPLVKNPGLGDPKSIKESRSPPKADHFLLALCPTCPNNFTKFLHNFLTYLAYNPQTQKQNLLLQWRWKQSEWRTDREAVEAKIYCRQVAAENSDGNPRHI